MTIGNSHEQIPDKSRQSPAAKPSREPSLLRHPDGKLQGDSGERSATGSLEIPSGTCYRRSAEESLDPKASSPPSPSPKRLRSSLPPITCRRLSNHWATPSRVKSAANGNGPLCVERPVRVPGPRSKKSAETCPPRADLHRVPDPRRKGFHLCSVPRAAGAGPRVGRKDRHGERPPGMHRTLASTQDPPRARTYPPRNPPRMFTRYTHLHGPCCP